MLAAPQRIMDISEMKPLLPLDFSLSMKSELSLTALGAVVDPIHTKRDGGQSNNNNNNCNGGTGGGMLLSPEKGSSSAFKVVTPKHCDGRSKMISKILLNTWFLEMIYSSLYNYYIITIVKIYISNIY